MNEPRCSRSGVSLLVVMTILSLMTVLAAAFIRVMRSAETVATGSADRSVAGGLADAALARAIEEIDATMQGVTCPYWGGMPAGADNAMSSTGAAECVDLFRGDITNLVPRALWKDAATAATNGCGWIEVPHPDGSNVLGRMAYLVVNVSGLPDVESMVLARGQAAGMVTNMVYDIGDYETFTNEAWNIHRRYESVAELLALNSGVYTDASNLFVSAWRLDPDWYFEVTNLLGNTGIELLPKFNLNSFTNYEASLPPGWTRYEDALFRTNYWAGLTNRLTAAGYPESDAELLGWNIVNWLDEDSLPQGVSNAWREPIVEAVPMVNEIALREVHGGSNEYEFVVETWYPFAGATNEGFTLQVWVFTNLVSAAAEDAVTNHAREDWSFSSPITGATTDGFFCVTSPPATRISFPVAVTNPPGTIMAALSATNSVWFLARVLRGSEPVDEAMGYAPGSDPALMLKHFTNTAIYAVASPFLNGRAAYWEPVPVATFGTTNTICDPWVNGAGLPVVHRDGPMRAIGEIGYVMMPEPGAPWGDVNLVVDPGAALVDVLCAARESEKCRGLFHPGCAPEEVLRALFRTARVGVNGDVDAAGAYLSGADADMLARVVRGFVPDRAGDVLAAFGDTPDYLVWPPDGVHTNGNYKEDAVRYIAEAFAFRKNTFIVVYSGQALTPNGRGVRATARGVAYVCRDSYTGRCTVLLRRGLLD